MAHLHRALMLLVVPVVLALALPWLLRSLPAPTGASIALTDTPWLLVPNTFGEHGYYRGSNVHEWIRMPAQFSPDNSACAQCHRPVASTWARGEHRNISCQTCHGARLSHIQGKGEPSAPTLELSPELCLLCHDAGVVGRPIDFPKIIPGEHSGGLECTLCHNPHSPRPEGGR